MTAALLAATTVWLVVRPPAADRVRGLWVERADRGPIDVTLVGPALAPVVGIVVLGFPGGLVAGLVAVPFVRAALQRLESSGDRRRHEQLGAQLPAALDLVGAALEAGRPPGSALELTAEVVAEPMRDALARVARRLEVSGDMGQAFADAPVALDGLGRAMRRADVSGAAISDVVAAVAEEARRERRSVRREAARRVGVSTTVPLGLCFLPAFFLIGIVPTVVSMAGSLLSF